MIDSIYKILSKVLTNRMKRVLPNIISNCQSAFLEGRQILDGVLVVNELVDFAKRAKKEWLMFKVDFEKAYDSISWDYLKWLISIKANLLGLTFRRSF